MAKKQELSTAGLRETRRRVRQAEENLRRMRAAQDSNTNYAQSGSDVGRLIWNRDGSRVPATPVTPTRISNAQRELRNARAQWRRQQAVAIYRDERDRNPGNPSRRRRP